MTTAELAGDPHAAIVEGIDVDAVATRVRACAGVSDLVDGAFGDCTSYLPGRRVIGVSVSDDMVRVSIRAKWGVPARDLLDQITSVLQPTVADRRIEVVIADIDDLPSFAAQPPIAVPAGPVLPATGDIAVPAGSVVCGPAVRDPGRSNDPGAASREPDQPPPLL